MIKKLGLSFISIIIACFAVLLILLRYPTPVPKVQSQFAKRADLEGKLPPITVSVFKTGKSAGNEAFLVSGGGLLQTRSLVHTAILVEHPNGNFLIDTGLGRNIHQELSQGPWLVDKLFPLENPTALIDQEAFKTKVTDLNFILITHGHWDHLSGALDIPDIPIYLRPEEIQFVSSGDDRLWHGVFPQQIEAISPRFKPIQLKDIPYENFNKSLDWFGDQSIVLVPLSGHTPGSLGIFINISSRKRLLIVGDALWTVDANGKPEKRSLLAELFSDFDRIEARKTREKLRELIGHSNEITLVPIHDEVALEKIHLETKKEN